MKRLLLTSLLSVAIHLFFLGMNVDRHRLSPAEQPKSEALSFTLIDPLPDLLTPHHVAKPPAERLLEPKIQKKRTQPQPAPKPNPALRESAGPRPKEMAAKKPSASKPQPSSDQTSKPRENRTVQPSNQPLALEPVIPSLPVAADQPIPSKPSTSSASLAPPKTAAEKKDSTASLVARARPLYDRRPPLKYPSVARRRGYQGAVVLEVLIDKDGKVADLKVLKSSGYQVLDRAAIQWVQKWAFVPAMQGDEKIEAWVEVPVRFSLN